MQTMTLSEFKALLESPDWTHASEVEVIDHIDRQVEGWDDEDDDIPGWHCVSHTFGWGAHIATLGEISIRYEEGFNYDDNDVDSFASGTEGLDEVWSVEGLTVVDDENDDEEVGAHDLADHLPPEFEQIDYSGLKIETTTDIDYDEDSDMETFTLQRDNKPDLRFSGERIGSASSTDEQAITSSYSGQTGRWAELELYKTEGGRYVCHMIGRTRWQGERDRHSGRVCDSEAEVGAFFGHRWLAKELYEDAGIDHAVEIE